MTRDDIIRMAREAGFESHDAMINHTKELQRFAALVAAAEQKKFCNELAALHDRYSLQSNPKFLSARNNALTLSAQGGRDD